MPITNLNLLLPSQVKEPRVGGKALADSLLTLKNGKLAGALGPVEKLDVRWRKPGARAAKHGPRCWKRRRRTLRCNTMTARRLPAPRWY